MMSLAADIGGTYSRLAWFGDGRIGRTTEQVFDNAEFDSLESVIAAGQAQLGQTEKNIDRMVLAVPGPVQREPIELTNINWTLQRDRISARFQVNQLTIINDFQAAALGAVNEPYERLTVLNPVTPDDGPAVVTGAGTGLGMAWMATRDQKTLPYATEGGHIDFAPHNAEQLDLYRWLADRYGHVSYERILSGDGLVDTYRHVAGGSAQANTPAQIAELAGHSDTHAMRTVQLFVAVFAAYAGNLALAFNPSGGLYLCGGLTSHLARWFEPAVFMVAFTAKGRMADVVRRIPVYLVSRRDTGLAGAIRVANAAARSPWD